jgi:TolB-like protein/DNA-binding winged helix-turn-helix (wHTH) protein
MRPLMDAPSSPAPFRLGRWQVQPRAGVITCGEESVRVDDRALRVLGRLAATPGEVVSVDGLLDAAWPDVVVSPDSVYQAIATLRRALGDPSYIVTVARQGYRLAAPVTADSEALPPASAPEPSTPPKSPGAAAWVAAALLALLLAAGAWMHGRPIDPQQAAGIHSVAVLPFADLTDAMDKEPFADGVTEQLIESLARLPGAHVASRTDSVAIKPGQAVAAVAAQLHVHWLIEGSVRKSGERLRVTARLVRAGDGSAVWSHDYDSTAVDALKLQDEIAADVARALQRAWGADAG